MYRTGKKYKIELKNGIFYTAKIISEDDSQILINTIRGEELILSKSEILRALLMDQIGVKDE